MAWAVLRRAAPGALPGEDHPRNGAGRRQDRGQPGPGEEHQASPGTRGRAQTPPTFTKAQLDLLLALTGMRRGEALAVRWPNVDLEKGILKVRQTRSVSGSRVYEDTPKTDNSVREVPLSAEAIALLKHVKATNEERRVMLYPDQPPSPYVFSTLTGTPQRPDNVRRILRQLTDLANARLLETERSRASGAGEEPRLVEPIPYLPVHALRHTFVSVMAERGVPLKRIAAWIGDNVITMMTVYMHLIEKNEPIPDMGLLPDPPGDEQPPAEGRGD